MPLFVFFGLLIVSCSLICLWPLVFVLKNTLILGIWCSTIPHLPGCFCPWTFFENIGFNTVLTLLNLDILQGSFRLCNGLSLRRLVSWNNHLPPACWSTFWKSNFKQQLGCRFDIMDNISYFLCVLTYATIYVLIHQIIFRFYLLRYSLIFQALFVLTSSIDVVFILSTSIGLDNGLAPNRRQAIICINADPLHWRINAALGRNEIVNTTHVDFVTPLGVMASATIVIPKLGSRMYTDRYL